MQLMTIDLPAKHDEAQVFTALTFFAEQLMSKRMLNALEIRIAFVPGLTRREKIEADCVWDDTNDRPRDFIIRIDPRLGKRRTLVALAHEMVHVKQYATGQMKDLISTKSELRWNKKRVCTDNVPYAKLPWEIEAHGMESVLVHKFMEHWKKEGKNAKAAYEAEPDCAGTPHTFIRETRGPEQEDL